MTESVQTAFIVGSFAVLTQFCSRLWSRVEHKDSIAIAKRIELDVNSARNELVTQNKDLTAKVLDQAQTIARLQAELIAKDLAAATLVVPRQIVAVVAPVEEIKPKEEL
jgi:hypothetical protein